MNNTNIAWTRTTFTAFWMGLVLWAAAKAGWTIKTTDPWVILVIGLTGGVVWRVTELLANVKYLGYIFFGINKAPGYSQPTPPNPEDEAAAPYDLGYGLLELIVIIVVVVLALYALTLLF